MRGKLSTLYFLQFAVWGCYLTSLGQFLGAGGLGRDISWFYAAIGIVSILTPAFMGYLSDRLVSPVRLLGICHVTAGLVMTGIWWYAAMHPKLEFGIIYPLYLLFLAFYMPTMALSNTAAFRIIRSAGRSPVDCFPSIRVWGTVGFICAMWWVNATYWHDGVLGWTLTDNHPFAAYRFQYTAGQLLCSGIAGITAGLYTFSLPSGKAGKEVGNSGSVALIFKPGVMRDFFRGSAGSAGGGIRTIGVFLIFVAFIGVCMQISNGFATPYISHFMGEPEYARSFAAGNATMLFSLSQISEMVMILAVGKSLKRWGIGVVFGLGILAWSLRFLFLGIGNPGDGLVWLVASMIIYGVAFNFITIAGHLHMERVAAEGSKGLGQGMMMLMGNGIGATLGIMGAGAVINHWCSWEMVEGVGEVPMRLFMGNWIMPWLIFTVYAFMIFMGWVICCRKKAEENRFAPA